MSTPSSTVPARDPWRPTGGEITAAVVVRLALAALAAFSLWGLNPSSTSSSSSTATPAATTAAPAGEREDGGD